MTLTTSPTTPIAPTLPTETERTPASLDRSALNPSGYWGHWQNVNSTVMIEHSRSWMERLGWVDNFRAAADGTLPERRRGREFTDSDVYKLIEAMSWELGRKPADARLRAKRDDLVRIIAAAQEPDGYLNTMFGRPGQAPRYSDLEWGHELYDYGHLLQAAVAATRVDGPGLLLDIARAAADHIVTTFGDTGDQRYCGHPNIEPALVEFGRLTEDERYIRQAQRFVERRGSGRLRGGEMGQEYFQDLTPVRETLALHGHAVRALYLAAGAVDVAVEQGDHELLSTLERQWEHTVRRRTHVTGGMGSRHTGEAFGDDWELSPDRAYCETCAGVGSVMFSWRLYLATGDQRYNDLIERTLFNIIATSPAPDGHSFFYSNPLQQRVEGEPIDIDTPSVRSATSERAPWFDVSCCPPNVSRTLAVLSTYAVTSSASGVQIVQYASGTWTVDVDGGPVTFRVETDYPRSGTVTVVVEDAPDAGVTMSVRVPSWAGTPIVRVEGSAVAHDAERSTEFTGVMSGDTLQVTFDMRARFVSPAPQVDALRGCLAVEQGPRVFALEGIDLPAGHDIADIEIDPAADLAAVGPDLVEARGWARSDDPAAGWPYATQEPAHDDAVPVRLLLRPYAHWGERGRTTMRVWLPVIA